jgi:hypothetical protein
LFIIISGDDDFEKYRPLREQCQRTPSSAECLQVKSKFLDLIKKCQKIQTQNQLVVCQEIKNKLCSIFPSICTQATTKTTRRTSTKSKVTTTTKPTVKPKIVTTTRITDKPKIVITTDKPKLTTGQNLNHEEFVKVPVNPDELRTRGEYCIRHGKEKKCQELLTNLKTTYTSCSKKKPQEPITKPEQLDCHSFQTHLCKAFPKFPPCIKKTP